MSRKGGGRGKKKCHQVSHRGRGGYKKCGKSVTYYLNGPLPSNNWKALITWEKCSAGYERDSLLAGVDQIRVDLKRMNLNECEWIWMSLNKFEWMWMNLNECEWIWMNVNEFEWIWVNLNEFEWIWKNLNEFEWIWVNLNEFEWIWKNLNEFEWIWMSLNNFQRLPWTDWWFSFEWFFLVLVSFEWMLAIEADCHSDELTSLVSWMWKLIFIWVSFKIIFKLIFIRNCFKIKLPFYFRQLTVIICCHVGTSLMIWFFD